MKNKFAKLIDLKSIITVLLTIGMLLLLGGVFNPPESVFQLYSTVYVAVMTYYFTKKNDKKEGE